MDGQGVSELITFVVNNGVAIGVLAFMLIRMEARLQAMEAATNKLTLVLQQLLDLKVNGKIPV